MSNLPIVTPLVHLGHFDQRRVLVERSSQRGYVRDGRPIPKPPVTPEAMDHDAVATLLYSGTVFPPRTVFLDFAAVGMGGTLRRSGDGWAYEEAADLFADWPIEQSHADFDPIDELSRGLERSGIDLDSVTLLLSEGKDSTAIALAFAQLGKRVECFTFANSDTNVQFIEKLARDLGHGLSVFRYSSLRFPKDMAARLARVFEPTLDQAFLSYLLLPADQFDGRTLIDGMGNDIYMGHLPSVQQRKATLVCDAVAHVVPARVRSAMKSVSFTDSPKVGVPFRTFTECQGLYNGLSGHVIERSIGGRIESLAHLDKFWKQYGFQRARALSRGRYLDTYSYSGKSVALAEMAGGTVYFPWADQELVPPYASLADSARYLWPTTNKLPLRRAIGKRLDYQQAKVGFRAPVEHILEANAPLVRSAVATSRILGQPLKDQVASLPLSSPRMAQVSLFALWESATR